MSFWQFVYLAIISGASVSALAFHFRAAALAMAVLWLNFAATMVLVADFRAVAILDIACAAVLAFGNSRAQGVAFLFTLMVPVYFLGFYLEWTKATTYTIIDVIAYLQCAIIGWPRGSGAGNKYSRWFLRGGRAASGGALVARLASVETLDLSEEDRT